MTVSERVHLGEIVVILAANTRRTGPSQISCRLPCTDGADISQQLPSALPGNKNMAIERTSSITKPDATARSLTGAINAMTEKAGIPTVAQKRIRMTRQ